MTKLKAGVKFGNHYIAMAFAMQVVESVFIKHNQELVITSFNDGRHGTGSLHPHDKGVDFRSHDIPTLKEKELILKEIQEALTDDFDVLLEYVGKSEEHYHLEFQPAHTTIA